MGGSSGATRLDGLVSLLDSGTTATVRKMAATQIGDLVAAFPPETRPVLRRVRRLLRSDRWETRVAASQAVAAIAELTPRFVPQRVKAESKSENAEERLGAVETKVETAMERQEVAEAGAPDVSLDDVPVLESGLTFPQLDIDKLMKGGAMLFGSTGDEYKDAETDVSAQRAKLKADLGLDDRFVSNDMLGFKDEDLVTHPRPADQSTGAAHGVAPVSLSATADVVAEMSIEEGLSARERNRRKREAKKRARTGADMRSSRPPKRPRGNDSGGGGEGEVFSLAEMANGNGDEELEYDNAFGSAAWDFQPTCEVLKHGLLESKWERRHGAAIGLRQILMRHAVSAGRKSAGVLGDEENARWLEDVCCRLLCVLAMDRFGDFVGDAVMAPVREAAAMTIGATCRVMSAETTRILLKKVFYLFQTESSSQWEVRHAALLGARYILAVKDNMAEELLQLSFAHVTGGLRDPDDDVRAVAAEALLPVADKLISFMPQSVTGLVTTLWEALLDLDDISASTSSVLRLLSTVTDCTPPVGCNALWLDLSALNGESDEMDEESETVGNGNVMKKPDSTDDTVFVVLTELVPRLWPFLRHSSKAVRRAAIHLLETLTTSFTDEKLLHWIVPIFGELASRLFRNILFETETDIFEGSRRVWGRIFSAVGQNEVHARAVVHLVGPLLNHWLQLSSQETRAEAATYDETQSKAKITLAARRRKAAAARRAAKARKSKGVPSVIPHTEHDSGDSRPAVEGPFDGVKMQQHAAASIGYLAVCWPPGDATLERLIVESLQSPFAVSRRVACDICANQASLSKSVAFAYSDDVRAALEKEMSLDGGCVYAEVGAAVGSFFTDSLAFLETVSTEAIEAGIDTESMKNACSEGKKAVSLRDYPTAAVYARSIKPHMSILLSGDTWEYLVATLKERGAQKRRMESLQALRMRILSSIGFMTVREDLSKNSLAASATAALISSKSYQLPPKVGVFIKALTAALRTSKNPHLQDLATSALATLALRLSSRESQKPLSMLVKNLMKYVCAEQTISDALILSSASSEVVVELDSAALAKRGALSAFKEFCFKFGETLFAKLPGLWQRVSTISEIDHSAADPSEEVKQAMVVLRALVAHVSSALHGAISAFFPHIVQACGAPHDAYAEVSPACLADVVASIPGEGMRNIVTELVPLLSGSQHDRDSDRHARRGAARALRAVVDRMGSALIPYAAFMIVPMMMRMVDTDDVVRNAAAGVFGTLVRLMPLEGGAPDDPLMSQSMAAERQEARSFLGQLLGTEQRSHYELPTTIGGDITLRQYQQECLDWLAFLNRYGLHGALCDDMGLGKTLMTLCMITGDYISNLSKGIHLPSLVICPSTIVAHWCQEAERFFSHALPHIVLYAGSPRDRGRIRESVILAEASVVVTSYDILGNDLKHFENIRWNYVVLDEGHVIKNPKTRIARAVRMLSPDHRLILTGTPIQNSVLELWAMFDFLMPGFLGTEKVFKETYAKPIMASRNGKGSEVDHERAMVATEALHRQVLPFVLRRLKDDVLSELPPKIIQDYYCDMTPLQLLLYEDFATGVQDSGGVFLGDSSSQEGKKSSQHVFQALTYLRQLCSHPKLVLTPTHSQYGTVQSRLRSEGKSIDDISSSAKLVGLMNILQECGIGVPEIGARDSGGHRVLIFAQAKKMLDVVETDLFQVHMPDVSYLRLDGSVEASKRQPIVTRFNADPTIDVLLLTTHVGGLGLNLTGADTVIFLEHDWNPTKDLQAMDRAHRMGQKRTVNVYRLITRGTLEEKIMGIQRFKTHIANTVVNRDNSNLQSMNTEQLLDLFKVEGVDASEAVAKDGGITGQAGKKSKAQQAIEAMGELWEETQYEDEYNMEDFLAGMSTKQG